MDVHRIQHPIAVARAVTGMSMADLASAMRAAARRHDRRAGTTKQQIFTWEQPSSNPPSTWSQQLMAEALGVDPELVPLLGWPYWLPGNEAPLMLLGTGDTVAALREAPRRAMLNRRTLLGLAPAALVTLAHQWATVDPALAAAAHDGKEVAPEFVTWLETSVYQLTSMATADRQHTAQLLDSYYDTVVGLLEGAAYTQQVGIRLQLLASALAQTIGWYQFDNEHHTAAAHYWSAALHAAHHAGDTDRGAGILSDLAYQSMWLGDASPAVAVLDRALTRTQDRTARSLLNLRKARALAMVGEARASRRSLDAAEHCLNIATGTPPAWCSWMGAADLAVDTGRCLIDLGEPRPAHQQIAQGVSLLPGSRDKTRAVFLTYEAESLIRQGEIDNAAATARQALVLAQHIGATRCIRQITSLSGTLEPYSRTPGVGEFLEAVQAAA
ncbi:XRE family transcriptional regulator [Kitasatospora sp. NPDC094028]